MDGPRRVSRPTSTDVLPNARNTLTFRIRLLDGDETSIIFDVWDTLCIS